jgi:hypothetical protein
MDSTKGQGIGGWVSTGNTGSKLGWFILIMWLAGVMYLMVGLASVHAQK